MKCAPGLWHIVLGLLLIVTYAQPAGRHLEVWDERLVPPGRGRQYRNPRRNRERWARRLARQQRRRPPVSRAKRRRRGERAIGQILNTILDPALIEQERERSRRAIFSMGKKRKKLPPTTQTIAEADPLADLRRSRGWIDHMDERELWKMLIRIRWPHGPACPHCGERDVEYLKLMDAGYHGGLGRW